MKMKKEMKLICGFFAAGLVFSAVAAEPTISDVKVHQRWPWNRLVDIEYTLDCDDPADEVDISLVAYNGSDNTPLVLPEASLSGDISNVREGVRRIVWDPTKSAYTNEPIVNFKVALSPLTIPSYIIVDLLETPTGDRVTYVTAEDLASGAYGACVTNTINDEPVIAWMDVTNDITYATDKLVLRRVPAGEYLMNKTIPVTLTKDFYIGVFEFTQKQWWHITGSYKGYFTNPLYRDARPVDSVSYKMIRGDNIGTNWPASHAVDEDSFLFVLRERTGISDIDLPTEAQWEYACRAGTTTARYNGTDVIGPENTSDVNLDSLGRYKYNGGYINGTTKPSANCSLEYATARVGSYQPNGWGLYDMYGNLYEWCLNWESGFIGGVDPVGYEKAGSRVARVIRGGSYFNPGNRAQSTWAASTSWTGTGDFVGFRVVWTLP